MLGWLALATVEAHGGHHHDQPVVFIEDLLRKIEKLPESVRQEFADLVSRTDAGEQITEFPWLRQVFALGPLANSLLAIALMTVASVAVLWVSPPLEGLPLSFLVAFAAGCLLGNALFHLLPSAVCSGSATLMLVPAVSFIVFAYLGKLIASSQGSSGHTHSHDVYAHRHTTLATSNLEAVETTEVEEIGTSTAVEGASETAVRKRTVAGAAVGSHAAAAASSQAMLDEDTELFVHTEGHNSGAFAIINVGADFLHNLVDGAALAMAFDASRDKGILSFVLMCAHEVPHQFGDFALLIQTGMSKPAAIAAHLATSSGLAFGALTYGLVKKFHGLRDGLVLPFHLGVEAEELVEPALAGVFLYIATMGVFPELLESESRWHPLVTTAAQIAGLAAGLYLMMNV